MVVSNISCIFAAKSKNMKKPVIDTPEDKIYRKWVRSGYLTEWMSGDDVRRKELSLLFEEAWKIGFIQDAKIRNNGEIESIILMIVLQTIRALYVHHNCRPNISGLYVDVDAEVTKQIMLNKNAFSGHDLDSEVYVQESMISKYTQI